MTERFEYRLRWQRLGRKPTTRIMQTEKAATEKAGRMLELDEVKKSEDLTGFANMPDLISMSLERRPVGDWRGHSTFDVPDADPDWGTDVEQVHFGDEIPW